MMFGTNDAIKDAAAIRKEIKSGDQSWRQDINARHVELQLKIIRNALDDIRFAIECRADAPDLPRLNEYCAGQIREHAERLSSLAKIITHEEAVPMPVEAEIAIRLHKAATEATTKPTKGAGGGGGENFARLMKGIIVGGGVKE